jgi:ABC-type transport system involved in cytochrome bd biosynthesis fused ATPase/permease subunit
LAGILATIANLLQFAGPITISKVLQFLNEKSEDKNIGEGVFWVTILIVCYLARTIIFQHSMHFVNLSCIQVLNSANSLIYNKIIKLSSSARKYLDAGTIMNNVNVDVMSFYFFIMMSTFVFSAPVMITVAIVMLVL